MSDEEGGDMGPFFKGLMNTSGPVEEPVIGNMSTDEEIWLSRVREDLYCLRAIYLTLDYRFCAHPEYFTEEDSENELKIKTAISDSYEAIIKRIENKRGARE